MLVKYWMHPKVETIEAEDSMENAIKLMKQNDRRLLPVTRQGRLVGVVTDRDIKRASASEATSLEVHELLYLLSKIKVASIMSSPAISVPPDFTVEETAAVLLRHRISGVPVVEEGRIVGVITQAEVNRLLVALTGLGHQKQGLQLAFLAPDQPGSIKQLTDEIRAYDGRLLSILSSYDRVPEGSRKIYIRAYNLERDRLPELLAKMRTKAKLLYLVDHRYNRREIFDQGDPPCPETSINAS
jgi:acetoin utilization protein AcuB